MRFLAWLRSLTVVQAILLFFASLGAFTLVSEISTGPGVGAILWFVFFGFLFAYSRWKNFLLWRVRNRLLFSYFLFGVVPVVLIVCLVALTGFMMLGQVAANRVNAELDRRLDWLHAAALDLAASTSADAQLRTFNTIRQRIPNLGVVVDDGSKSRTLNPAESTLASIPEGLDADLQGFIKIGKIYYLAARADSSQAATRVLAYIPLDRSTLDSLAPGTVFIDTLFEGDEDKDFKRGPNFTFNPKADGVRVTVDGKSQTEIPVEAKSVLGPAKGFWDREFKWALARNRVKGPRGGNVVLFTLTSRPSLLLEGVFKGNVAPVIILIALSAVGSVLLVVEFISLVWSLLLTRSITRSVHDLYEGTRQVTAGNFTHRTPVRNKDQLGELAGSFNSMTEQVQKLLVEVREKEKLKAELEIARQVQTRLFPKNIPQLKTLEMAGVCLPGRIVSGDYYDFIPLNSRWTALALADVSGKGISAALVMASVQSSLHAQLQFAGSMGGDDARNDPLSTATLMGRMNQQLYENTPSEKYATFFCSLYDDQTGNLSYTNGGHLRPILIRNGAASTLDGDGMVVGLLPNISYEQHIVQLRSGDLLAIFSDGVPEAEDAKADQFGEDRLSNLLKANASKPLDQIIQALMESVHAWVHDPEGQDDTTIVIARMR